MSRSSPSVARRRVFYIPGYDPIHPRRYRELYRTESAAQAAVSGYDITLTGRQGADRYGWDVGARIEGAQVDTSVEVLVWSDIVRDSMKTSIAATYLQLVQTAWVYLATGSLFRLMRLRKGPVIAALYPVGMLILQAVVAITLGLLSYMVLAAGVEALARVGRPGFDAWRTLIVLGYVLSGAAGAGTFYLTLRWFKRKDGRFFAHYLMHDYAFGAATRGAYPPALEVRMAAFADAIAEALTGDADEVLVVGHSSGAHIAISVLANLIRQGRVPDDSPSLGFLSLGQVVPMVSFLPDAQRLRADLAYLSARTELAWVDVTAPGDGCAFALCDPVSVSGVAPANKRLPLVISAAFTQTLSPARWKELRWRFFRLHFQYLCAFDRPGEYDYFRITAGPVTLADRFRGRKPSASRIETPVNRYTDTTT